MKKIIAGKRYDTDTAEIIAQDSFGYAGDFRYWWERLHRTRKGNWFLWGEGGARSHYAQSLCNGSIGGEDIRRFSIEEARDWLELHQCLEALEEYFSDDLEDA